MKLIFPFLTLFILSCDKCDCSINAFEKISEGHSKEFVENKIIKSKPVKVDIGIYSYDYTYKCENSEDVILIMYEDSYGKKKVSNKSFNPSKDSRHSNNSVPSHHGYTVNGNGELDLDLDLDLGF